MTGVQTCALPILPFDSRSPFQTSGIRLGTPAITTRGLTPDLMGEIATMVDTVLGAPEDNAKIASVGEAVVKMMSDRPIFAW